MNKLTFIKGDLKRDILINRVKYIAVTSNSDYWLYNRCLHSVTEKPGISDYSEEYGNRYALLIDEELTSKTDELLFVNHSYNLDEDLKLGSKSLALRYVSNMVQDSVFAEELLQLNSMLQVYSDFLSTEDFAIESIDLNAKTIPKIIKISALLNDLRVNSYDLDYEQTIMTQLKMIACSNTADKTTWVVVEVLELSKRIKSFVETLSNMNIIVLFARSSVTIDSYNVFYDDYDLENDEELYERMNIMTKYYELNDFKKELLSECNESLKSTNP